MATSKKAIVASSQKSLFSSSLTPTNTPLIFNKSGNIVITDSNNQREKNSGKKIHANMIIPEKLLVAASEQTSDPFWSDVLLSASKGKWFRGFRFKNGMILYQQKNKLIECPVNESMSPADVARDVIAFIQSHGGHQSVKDKKRDRDALENAEVAPTKRRRSAPGRINSEEEPTFWTTPRSRPFYLSRYIDDMVARHGLSSNEKAQLVETLRYAGVMNWIDKESVVFSTSNPQTISDISTVRFNPETRKWTSTPRVRPPPKKSAAAVAGDLLDELPEGDLFETPLTAPRDLCPSSPGKEEIMKSIKARIRAEIALEKASTGNAGAATVADTPLTL